MTACGPFTFEAHVCDSTATKTDASSAVANYEFCPAGIARICANDVDEAAEQIRDWQVELTQFERGPAQVNGIMIPLGSTLVGRGRCTKAVYTRGTAPRGSVTFLFKTVDLAGRAGVQVAETDTCIVYGSGAELNNYSTNDVLSIGVSISRPKWLELKLAFGFDLACDVGQSQILTVSSQYSRSINTLLDEISTTVEGLQDGAIASGRATAWESSVLATVVSMLGLPQQLEASTRDRAGRYRAVRRAQEFIRDNLSEHLSLLQLCDASLASARTLEYGFRELFGVSPLTYVRYERLGRVHRELHRARRNEASVTDVAMRWGFGHLGQFSKEYRGLFGECPSETLSRERDGRTSVPVLGLSSRVP